MGKLIFILVGSIVGVILSNFIAYEFRLISGDGGPGGVFYSYIFLSATGSTIGAVVGWFIYIAKFDFQKTYKAYKIICLWYLIIFETTHTVQSDSEGYIVPVVLILLTVVVWGVIYLNLNWAPVAVLTFAVIIILDKVIVIGDLYYWAVRVGVQSGGMIEFYGHLLCLMAVAILIFIRNR